MKIGIDARFYGLDNAGIGRYAKNLVDRLGEYDQENIYIVLVPREANLTSNFANVKYIPVTIPHYSMREQFEIARIFKNNDVELVHFLHYNVPLIMSGIPFVVTIFDLIKSKYPDVSAQTSIFKKVLKRVGYQLAMSHAVHKSQHIITGAKAVATEIVQKYQVSIDKTTAIPLAVDDDLQVDENAQGLETLRGLGVKHPYLLYVGNAYRYKNVETLIEAMPQMPSDLQLIIVGARSVFRDRLEQMVTNNRLQDRVVLTGFVPDAQLKDLYKNAAAFVSASLIEGFGIPPLEAMGMGCCAIVSDISVHREVLGDAALYFNPNDCGDFVAKVNELLASQTLQKSLTEKGYNQVRKYSWAQMMKETLAIYDAIKIHSYGT